MSESSNSEIVHPADKIALEQILSVRPEWIGQGVAAALTGGSGNVLLHAGPGFGEPAEITEPILNSACVAAVYEGLAESFDSAREKILTGQISLQPAQDYSVVTPLASVVSMSMPLHIVRDANQHDVVAFAPVNGGGGPAMRLGICDQNTLDHLRWLNSEFADQLTFDEGYPIDLIDIAREAIYQGDDCHGRTVAATGILANKIGSDLNQHAQNFLADGPSFFLNLWMAAVKCIMLGGSGVKGSSLIVAAGANGVQTGIQVSGFAGQWITAKATPPIGGLDTGAEEDRKLGAIGDSAVVDAMGFGAMCMNLAPAQKLAMGKYMPKGGLQLPARILEVVHPAFGDLSLRTATLARTVKRTGLLPVVSLGILDRLGKLGRLGGGIFPQPATLFEQAVMMLEADAF